MFATAETASHHCAKYKAHYGISESFGPPRFCLPTSTKEKHVEIERRQETDQKSPAENAKGKEGRQEGQESALVSIEILGRGLCATCRVRDEIGPASPPK
ncbi:MAG: hypothetical protein HZA31_06915 [Opitutae bacterium]|nr:hypothetical protein [Opitutae bacterium]